MILFWWWYFLLIDCDLLKLIENLEFNCLKILIVLLDNFLFKGKIVVLYGVNVGWKCKIVCVFLLFLMFFLLYVLYKKVNVIWFVLSDGLI